MAINNGITSASFSFCMKKKANGSNLFVRQTAILKSISESEPEKLN